MYISHVRGQKSAANVVTWMILVALRYIGSSIEERKSKLSAHDRATLECLRTRSTKRTITLSRHHLELTDYSKVDEKITCCWVQLHRYKVCSHNLEVGLHMSLSDTFT